MICLHFETITKFLHNESQCCRFYKVLSGKQVMSVMCLQEWALGTGGSTYIVDQDVEIFLSDRYLIYLFDSGQTKYLNDNFKDLSRGIFISKIVSYVYLFFMTCFFIFCCLSIAQIVAPCSVLLSHCVDNCVDYQVLRWLKKIILFLLPLH